MLALWGPVRRCRVERGEVFLDKGAGEYNRTLSASSSHPTVLPISCALSSSASWIALLSERYFPNLSASPSPHGVKYSISSPTASLITGAPPLPPPPPPPPRPKSATTTTLSGSHAPTPSPSTSSSGGNLPRVPYPVLMRMPTPATKSTGYGPADERTSASISSVLWRREWRQRRIQRTARKTTLSRGRRNLERW